MAAKGPSLLTRGPTKTPTKWYFCSNYMLLMPGRKGLSFRFGNLAWPSGWANIFLNVPLCTDLCSDLFKRQAQLRFRDLSTPSVRA